MPKRIQLRRTKGWRMPEGAISVARPTRWGNPWIVGNPDDEVAVCGVMIGPGAGYYDSQDTRGYDLPLRRGLTAAEAVSLYRNDLMAELDFANDDENDSEAVDRRERLAADLHALGGFDLACWCPLVDAHGQPVPCHADVLLELTNR